MFHFLKKLWRDRRGNALVIAAAAMPLVIGSAGLATDTIQWTLLKRQVQRSADSLALAGAFGRQSGQTVTEGSACSSNSALARDLTVGSVATRLGASPTCTVNTPPSPWNGSGFNAVSVTVQTQRTLPFTGWLIGTPTISASATAAMVQTGRYCMISLDNKAETGINFTGNPTVNLGCGMKTNAKGTSAIDCGGSSTITATPVAAVGYIPTCANFTSGTTYQSYAPPQSDPYSGINPPTVPSNCNQDLAFQGQTTSRTVTGTSATNPSVVCYTDFTVGSGKTFTGTDLIIIINRVNATGNGGNLTVQGTLDCTRCTFIMTSQNTSATPMPSGNVTINGGAHLNLSAPTSGTYNGILIYQDRRSGQCGNWCNKINGDATSTIQGAIYMPSQEIQVNGGSGMNTNCLQLVGWQLQFAGNTSISNSCPGGPGGFPGYMIRLVA